MEKDIFNKMRKFLVIILNILSYYLWVKLHVLDLIKNMLGKK